MNLCIFGVICKDYVTFVDSCISHYMLTKIYTGKESVYLYLFYVSTQANITDRLLVSLYMFAASAFFGGAINFHAFRFNRLLFFAHIYFYV